jgi:hypothetical protein
VAGAALPVAVLSLAAVETGRRTLGENPANPLYWANRAAATDDPADLERVLMQAMELAPREAIYASRLGLAREAKGDLTGAEVALRRGAELSRKFEPQWNLLNFFFRRGRWEEFWAQVPKTLEMSFDDRAALFELCSHAEGGGLDRLEKILPQSHEVRSGYAAYLISRGEFARAGSVIEGLAASANAGEAPTLQAWCEVLVANFEVVAASRVWKRLQDRGLVKEAAFPWRASNVPGVTIHATGAGAWQILLSGEQPEQCTLLARVFVPGAGKSRLQWAMDAELSAAAGLFWQVESFEKSPRVLAKSGELRSGAGAMDFDAPGGAVRVTLQFHRPLGSVRAEGRVELRVTEPRP